MRDLVGQTLGHYRIVEQIGAGGMGVVYRGHDERLDRDVAIKVLAEEVATDPDRLARFEREARAVAKLNHPNILAIHDFGTEDGVAYAVMELLEGESLREVISTDRLTVGKSVEYTRAIADGLAAAHEKGIVHRDLKPENVFLTRDGRIKILDFGLAKLHLPEQDLATETPTATLETQPGGLLGTVAYMAPEQVRGLPADDRSDIFAVGVVLYEMLTGHRPFGGSSSLETAAAILKEDAEPISAVSPTVPPALGGVVAQCLEKRPEDRFSSAHDLSLTLGAVDSAASGTVGPKRSSRRWHWPVVAVVAIAALIGFLFLPFPRGEKPIELVEEEAPPRIVVLPFENLGPAEDEFFADGITEEITARLASMEGLRVISRTSAVQYADTKKSIQEMGDELDVGYVLEGTVRWARGEEASRIRITPQLIRVEDDSNLWAETYDRVLDDVFEVQSEIAEKVTDQLGVTLAGSELEAVEHPADRQPRRLPGLSAGSVLRDTSSLHLRELGPRDGGLGAGGRARSRVRPGPCGARQRTRSGPFLPPRSNAGATRSGRRCRREGPGAGTRLAPRAPRPRLLPSCGPIGTASRRWRSSTGPRQACPTTPRSSRRRPISSKSKGVGTKPWMPTRGPSS